MDVQLAEKKSVAFLKYSEEPALNDVPIFSH